MGILIHIPILHSATNTMDRSICSSFLTMTVLLIEFLKQANQRVVSLPDEQVNRRWLTGIICLSSMKTFKITYKG